jgi:bifunctional polynucleotide phosphatase/kinase
LKATEEALKEGKSAVVDNTNPSPDVRAKYIDLAREYKVAVRCFYFDIPKDICIHNNTQRKINTDREHLSAKVPTVAIHSFFKYQEKPTLKEGYEEIKVIQFVPAFTCEEEEKTYYSYI